MRDHNKTKRKIIDGPATKKWLRSHDSAQVLLNMMEDAAVLISVDGVLLCLNEVAAHKLGDTDENLIGGNFYELFPPDVAAERRMRILEVVRSGMPIRSVDVEGAGLTETHVYPISHASGKIEMLALFSQILLTRCRPIWNCVRPRRLRKALTLPRAVSWHR